MRRMIVSMLAATLLLGAAGCGPEVSAPSQTQGTTQWTDTTSSLLPTIQPTTLPALPTTLPVTVPTIPTTGTTLPTTLPTLPTLPPTVPTTDTSVSPSTLPTQPGGDQFQPELKPGTTWEVHGCESFVNLRKEPDASSDSKRIINKGEKVEFLGWYGRFAKVRYQGSVGYVSGAYLRPADGSYMENALDTVQIVDIYTYDEMLADLIAFEQAYPDLVELEGIGYSEWGTQIPVMRIGNTDAQHHVLLHGSIHAREYFTTWLLMAMADYWLDRDLASYGDVCYHIIPMVNPDGVSIAQSGVLPEALMDVYRSDVQNGYTTEDLTEYARNWKANGQGVDLNRNYPTHWNQEDARRQPSSERYRGAEPFSAAETKVLRDYTLRYPFVATISYHATGSIIYYEYGNKQPVNSQSEKLANALYDLTGYYPMGNGPAEPTGYKDWVIDSLEIPAVTIEIGSGMMPLHGRELYALFVRNCDVLRVIAQWIT